MTHPRIEQRRGGLVETVHPYSAALVEGEALRWAVGPDVASFWRSGCKAMQLLNSLRQLPPEVVATLDDADLALGAASHSGQPFHVARVGVLLARFGLTPDQLLCGAHLPMHEPSSHALLRAGASPGAIHNNCSGKHTFMLAASVAQGWSPDYLPADHPLQQGNLALLTEWMAYAPGVAVDGCGVPCFHAPLSAMARAFARYACEMADAPDGLAGRIGWASHRQPEWMSGEGRLDLLVVRGAREPVAVKIGAEGMFLIAVPGRRWGIAVKVHTGNSDALAVAVRAVLDELLPGMFTPAEWPWADVRNVVGRLVGERLGG